MLIARLRRQKQGFRLTSIPDRCWPVVAGMRRPAAVPICKPKGVVHVNLTYRAHTAVTCRWRRVGLFAMAPIARAKSNGAAYVVGVEAFVYQER